MIKLWNGLSLRRVPVDNKPFMTFHGGHVFSTAYESGDYDDDKWIRNIPNPLRSNLIINYAMRDTTWAGGQLTMKHCHHL